MFLEKFPYRVKFYTKILRHGTKQAGSSIGRGILACLCTRKHDFAKRDTRDVLIHALL